MSQLVPGATEIVSNHRHLRIQQRVGTPAQNFHKTAAARDERTLLVANNLLEQTCCLSCFVCVRLSGHGRLGGSRFMRLYLAFPNGSRLRQVRRRKKNLCVRRRIAGVEPAPTDVWSVALPDRSIQMGWIQTFIRRQTVTQQARTSEACEPRHLANGNHNSIRFLL